MSKVYQPKVNEIADEIIQNLEEFYEEYEIDNVEYAREYFRDKLTEKFIQGKLDEEEGIFGEDEFEQCMKESVATCVLKSLEEKGYLQSYSDENTEEVFFLTEEGKEHVKKMKIGKK
jgi:hypothetical protein